MNATKTQPSPPTKKGPHGRTLRARWRVYMALGMGILVLAVAGSAGLIMILEQRQMIIRLHESTARQTCAAVQQAVDDIQHTLTYAGQTFSPDTVTQSDLERLLQTHSALREISEVGTDGIEVSHVPDQESRTAPDWSQHQAWIAATSGETYSGLSQFAQDPAQPVLTLAVPVSSESGVLIAQVDTQSLWQEAVSPAMGSQGYLYLLSDNNLLLAYSPSLETTLKAGKTPTRPADLPSVKAARQGDPSLKIYDGFKDTWVVGRAERIPGTNFYITTETPLGEFSPPLVRELALWTLVLALATLVGEWLVRRILKTVLRPLETLHQGARSVGAGDYGYRIRVPAHADHELADLARTFNDMIIRLQESQQQINAYTHEMEDIVDLRARELSRKAMQLEVAAELSSKIATILDPQVLINEVAELIQERFGVYHVEILLVNVEKGEIMPGNGTQTRESVPALTLRDDTTSVIAWAARNCKTLYVPDVTQEPRYRPTPDRPASRSALAIPLQFGGRVIGVLNLEADHQGAFLKDEITVLESLANEIAVSMHNAQVFEALETANRDLAQATLQAKQANLLKSRFLLNASHKLRTPLNTIIGYSETILSGMYGDIPEQALDRQRRILENGRVLQALIEDMLDLSSIETGYMELNLAWIDLPPLLDEVMNATRALHQTGYADHDLAFRLEMAEPLPPVWADLDRLRYILINLMSNAVKFTESGEVVMSVEANDDVFLIRVQDTGEGIADDEVAHLFEPFQHRRGSTASGGKGTGLGLPVSRLLAQMHGGDLTVDSVPHQGSTFTLRLPRHPDGAPPPPSGD